MNVLEHCYTCIRVSILSQLLTDALCNKLSLTNGAGLTVVAMMVESGSELGFVGPLWVFWLATGIHLQSDLMSHANIVRVLHVQKIQLEVPGK